MRQWKHQRTGGYRFVPVYFSPDVVVYFMNIIEHTFRNVMGHETDVFNVCIIVYCDIGIVQLFFVSIHLMSLGQFS